MRGLTCHVATGVGRLPSPSKKVTPSWYEWYEGWYGGGWYEGWYEGWVS